MLYTILAYHDESVIAARTPEQDAELMERLLKVNDKINEGGKLGPAARLDFTGKAVTLRGPGDGMVLDGPFAETKEQLLGLYVLECDSLDDAVAAARELRRVNLTAVYEIRPVTYYLPGHPVQGS